MPPLSPAGKGYGASACRFPTLSSYLGLLQRASFSYIARFSLPHSPFIFILNIREEKSMPRLLGLRSRGEALFITSANAFHHELKPFFSRAQKGVAS